MNGAQLEPLVRDLRKLVEAQATRDLSDAQLLEQFARGRDEAVAIGHLAAIARTCWRGQGVRFMGGR